ncbi:MAG TPA: hypothetical protein VFL57_11030 [Bryobacteraceae bacterium]|nr:hypothetical protein [Bryobacteraceae bacterium]
MNYRVLLAFVALTASTVSAQERKPRARPKRETTQAAIGCVDQRGETWILTGDRALRRVLTLQGDGFSNDNFARYLGHKVRVQGRLAETGSSIFRVREITTITETCKPDEP